MRRLCPPAVIIARAMDHPRARAALTAIVLAQWILLYGSVNHATAFRPYVYSLETALDRAIPMTAPWIFVYSLAYPVCIAPVFLLTLPRLRVACLAYTLAIAASLVTFVAFPVGMGRPEPAPGDYGTWLLGFTRWVDPPFNCFPSLHVSLDFIAGFMTCTERPAAGVGLLAAACVISVSTLYVKQHFALDVVAGALLAGLAVRIAMRPRWRAALGDVP